MGWAAISAPSSTQMFLCIELVSRMLASFALEAVRR